MHLTLCPYCTSRRKDAQAFVEGQSFLFAATSAILDSGNDKELCAMRKETIERVFADAKEKHAMRYTHHRGLARVSAWVRLKYVAMNLKKIAIWKWNASDFASYIMIFAPFNDKTPVLVF